MPPIAAWHQQHLPRPASVLVGAPRYDGRGGRVAVPPRWRRPRPRRAGPRRPLHRARRRCPQPPQPRAPRAGHSTRREVGRAVPSTSRSAPTTLPGVAVMPTVAGVRASVAGEPKAGAGSCRSLGWCRVPAGPDCCGSVWSWTAAGCPRGFEAGGDRRDRRTGGAAFSSRVGTVVVTEAPLS